MGKTQKKRAMRRHNPLRVPDSHLPKGAASESASSSKTEFVIPVMEKMESADSEERKWACIAIANMIQNDPSTRRLLQGKNIVGALIKRLSDSDQEVAVYSAGTLRNLCIDGGHDICAEMYNKNILTPLKTFVAMISTTSQQYFEPPNMHPDDSARTQFFAFSESIITILWCLSETSNKALNAVNQMNLVPFLMPFIGARAHIPLSTVTAAAQCLYVLTDDNETAIEELKANGSGIASLLTIVQTQLSASNGQVKEAPDLMFSVLVAGILQNLSPLPLPSPGFAIDINTQVVLPLLQPAISSVSVSEASKIAQELVSTTATEPQIGNIALQKNVPASDHKSATELELERLEGRLRTVQLALEILTGACATLPNSAGDTDDIDEDDMAMALDDAPLAHNHLPPSFTLVKDLLPLIQPTPLSFPPLGQTSVHPPMTAVLGAIHIRALEVLNNIFIPSENSTAHVLAKDKASGVQIWQDIWHALSAVGIQFGAGQERRREIWETSVGVLWGVGNMWKDALVANEEQIKILMQLCDASLDPISRVKCIGTLECLAQNEDSIDANKVIAEYFISHLPTPDSPSSIGTEPLVQIVSGLIDIYSDENRRYDINFRQGEFLPKLVDCTGSFRAVVKSIDMRKEGGRELRRHAEEVRENLGGFIKYRRSLRV